MSENFVIQQNHFIIFSFDRSCKGEIVTISYSEEIFEISFLASGDATGDLVTSLLSLNVMSQSIPTGYIPPGNPRENFFERTNPSHPGKFFCLILCPGAKNYC